MNIIKRYENTKKKERKNKYLTTTDYSNENSLCFCICFVLFYLAAFFGEAFFPGFGLAEVFFVAGFLVAVDFGFFAAAAFFGFEALLATFFAGVAAAVAGAAAAVPVAAALLADDVDVVLFLAFVVVAFVFGFTCRGFLVAFAPFELDRGFAAFVDLAFFGLTADDVALPLLATVAVVVELPLVAGFLTVFGPGDFDALRFLVGDDDDNNSRGQKQRSRKIDVKEKKVRQVTRTYKPKDQRR